MGFCEPRGELSPTQTYDIPTALRAGGSNYTLAHTELPSTHQNLLGIAALFRRAKNTMPPISSM